MSALKRLVLPSILGLTAFGAAGGALKATITPTQDPNDIVVSNAKTAYEGVTALDNEIKHATHNGPALVNVVGSLVEYPTAPFIQGGAYVGGMGIGLVKKFLG